MKQFPRLEQLREGSVILIDKPLTWTSFDAINKIKRSAKVKIGHCGTLDPLATGLLICCTGKMTKQITQYQKQDKVYTGLFYLGATTPTFDLESEPENFQSIEGINEEQIKKACEQFLGKIQQVPPAHSAIKLKGKRMYELARAGKEVELKARTVTINEFTITKIEGPEVSFRVHCSTGTYIRSLANDFGAALGCGAYLKALRREQIGEFKVSEAPTIEAWTDYLKTVREKEKTLDNKSH